MKNSAVLIIALIFTGCAIAPTEANMKEYVYSVETNEKGGVVTYMDITHRRFEMQPKEYAFSLINEHCKNGHKVTKTRTERKATHLGTAAATVNWKEISYKCK